MKRFYTEASRVLDAATGMHAILLDGRPVRTPARMALAVPGAALADAIVAEWATQGEHIDPASMPMTGFANATIDRALPDVAGFADGIAAYGASDLFCYRADEPAELVALQAAAWDPLLAWARTRYDIAFTVTDGIMPVDQPQASVDRLTAAVHALDPWLLAGLSHVVTIGGSLIGALALVEEAVNAATLWGAVQVDEDWQMRQWGEDADAMARAGARRAQFDDAARYCALVKGGATGLEA
jgi:chaperone required for assembly of F1-ATPase